MILLIDNYDSFTYNLFQYMSELGGTVKVIRNDKATVEELLAMGPERVVISPGPGTPADGGVSIDLINALAGEVPVLGVCLGHQCIGEAFGGKVAGAGEIMHGKASSVDHDGKGVFKGLPNPLEVIRYHSLAIVPESVPGQLEVTARSESGVIMGVRHREFPVEGIQFHPESILTEAGHDLLKNFMEM
jgi:anthranilate synthase component 2